MRSFVSLRFHLPTAFVSAVLHAIPCNTETLFIEITGRFYLYHSSVHEYFSPSLVLCKKIHRWPVDSPHKGQWHGKLSWWRHQMEAFSALLALCAGNSPVPVNSPHKGQWRGALMFSLICTPINGWVNNGEAGDLRRNLAHYDVTVMLMFFNWSVPEKTVEQTIDT